MILSFVFRVFGILQYQSHVIDGESCCPYEPVYCESKCGMRIPRKLASEHLRAECVNRLTACPFCGYDFVFDTLKVRRLPATMTIMPNLTSRQFNSQRTNQGRLPLALFNNTVLLALTYRSTIMTMNRAAGRNDPRYILGSG